MTQPTAALRFVTLGLGLLVMVLFGNYYDIRGKGFDNRQTEPFVHPTDYTKDKPGSYLTSISPQGVTKVFLGVIFLLLISIVWTVLLLMNLVPAEDEAVTKIDAAYHVIGGTILFIWALLFLCYDAFCPLINNVDKLKPSPIRVRCEVLKPCSPLWSQPLPLIAVSGAPSPTPPPCDANINPHCKTTMPTCIWYVANVVAGFVILVDGVLWIVMGLKTSSLSMAPITGLKGIVRIVVIVLTLLVMSLTYYSYKGKYRATPAYLPPGPSTLPTTGQRIIIFSSVDPLPPQPPKLSTIYGGTPSGTLYSAPFEMGDFTSSTITGFLILSIIWTVLLMLEIVESKQGDAACHLVAGIVIFLAHVWYIVYYAQLLSDYWRTPCEKIDWDKTRKDTVNLKPDKSTMTDEEFSYVKHPYNHHCAWTIVELVAGILGLIDGIICIVFAFL